VGFLMLKHESFGCFGEFVGVPLPYCHVNWFTHLLDFGRLDLDTATKTLARFVFSRLSVERPTDAGVFRSDFRFNGVGQDWTSSLKIMNAPSSQPG
jgi:hypothetical protein